MSPGKRKRETETENSSVQILRAMMHRSSSTSNCLLLSSAMKYAVRNVIFKKLVEPKCLNSRANRDGCPVSAFVTVWYATRYVNSKLIQICNKVIETENRRLCRGIRSRRTNGKIIE